MYCRYFCITNKIMNTINHLLKNALTDPQSLEYISDRAVMLGNIPSETNEYDIYDLTVDAGPITDISVQRDDDGETRAFIKFNYEDSVQRCIDNIRGIGYGNLIVEANPTNIIPTYTENIPNNINTSETEYKKETYIDPYRSRPIPKKKQKKYPTKPRSKNIVKPNKLSSVLI